MKATELEKSKPRNFVAKNAKMGGAGAHKDKKKAAKQGDVKHKSKEMAEDVVEAKAATASFRAGNKKRAELNSMSDVERRAYDKEQQEKQRKRDDARLERERQKLAAKKGVAESLETKLAHRVNSLLIEGAGVSDSHKKLASEYSDFHKDLHGMRPRHNEDEWHNEEFLQAQIDKLHATLDKMKSTPEGREALKADGWILDHEPAEDIEEGEFRRPGSPTAYDRDYASSVSGMGHKQSQAYQQDGGANDEGWGKEKYQHPEDKPRLLGYYFYDVPAGKEGEAAIYGVKKTKSGKWAKAKYTTSGRSYGMQKDGADKAFGPGKWWAPK